jgi:anti-anti-sigma factor
LADYLWSLLERHFTYRLVLDLSEVQALDRKLLSELLRLQRRVRQHGGLMRVCGLSPECQRVLQRHGLDGRLPCYCGLEDAVMGSWPRNPR